MANVADNTLHYERNLRQLLELAQDNQHAVQDAIACLTAEREALTKELLALLKSTLHSAEVSETVRRATAGAIPRLEAAAEKTLHTATEVEARAKKAGYRYAWQWTALATLGVAAVVTVTFVGVKQLQAQEVEVQRQQVELLVQKQAFSQEMARMQATIAFLEKKGARIQLDKCGPEQRPCIEVATDQGRGRNRFRGPWSDIKNERTFVIPKGY